MSSKIKVDTIENVAGSGNVSLGSGHNLVVPGNQTVGGTLGVTGASTLSGATLSGDLQVGASTPVSSAGIMSVVNAGNSLEWGHGNAAGYRSTLGAMSGGGQPFIGFSAEHGTNANTFRTRGLKGHAISTYDNAGSLTFLALQNANADNQTPVTTMTIDNSGRVFKPNQVSFIATGSNAAYINTSPIPFPNVVQNIGSHYNNSNYTFTAPVAGTYLFHLHLGLTQGHGNNQLYPYMAINGSNTTYTYQSINASTAHSNANMTQMFNLSANDTVKVNFLFGASSATYYNNAPECRFMGYLLG